MEREDRRFGEVAVGCNIISWDNILVGIHLQATL